MKLCRLWMFFSSGQLAIAEIFFRAMLNQSWFLQNLICTSFVCLNVCCFVLINSFYIHNIDNIWSKCFKWYSQVLLKTSIIQVHNHKIVKIQCEHFVQYPCECHRGTNYIERLHQPLKKSLSWLQIFVSYIFELDIDLVVPKI